MNRVSNSGQVTQTPVTSLDWRAISSAIPKGTPTGGFVKRTPTDLANATNSSYFKGFVFIGKNNIELNTTKGILLNQVCLSLTIANKSKQRYQSTTKGDPKMKFGNFFSKVSVPLS